MTPATPRPAPSSSRLAIRTLRVVGAAAIVALLALWSYLESASFADRARRAAEDRVGSLLGAPATIGRLEIDLLPPRLVAHGVVVGAVADEPGKPPLFAVDRLALHLSPFGLLRNRLQVEELALDGPRLRLDLPPPVRPPSRATARQGFDLQIRRLVVERGAVVWDNQEARLSGSVDDLDVRHAPGGEGAAGEAVGDLRIAGGEIDLRQRNGADALLPLRTVQIAYTALRDAVRLDSIRVAVGDSTLRGDGVVRGLSNAEIDVRGDLAVEDIFRLWSPPAPGDHAGRAQFAGTIDIRSGRPVVAGQLRASGVRAAGLDLTSFRAYLLLRRGRIALREVESRLLGGQLRGSVEVDTEQDPTRSTLTWVASDLDGAALTRWEPLSGWRFAGRASGAGELSWQRPFRATVRGHADLTVDVADLGSSPAPAVARDTGGRLDASERPAPTPSLPLPASGTVSLQLADGTVAIEGMAVRLPRTDLDVNGRVDLDGSVALGVRVQSDDLRMLDHLVAQYRRHRAGTSVARIGLRGSGSGVLTVGGTVVAPTLRGAVRGESLSVPSLLLGDVDGTIETRSGWIVSRDLSARRLDGDARGEVRLRIPARGHGHTADADDFAVDLRLRGYPVAGTLGPAATRASAATVASGTLALAGRFGELPVGVFELALADSRVAGRPVSDALIRGRRTAGFWQLDEIRLADGGDATASLLYVPGDDLLTLTVAADALDVGALLAPWDLDLGGVVEGRLRLSGPLRRLDGAADLRWRGASWSGVELGDVRLAGEGRDGILTMAAAPDGSGPAWKADATWRQGERAPIQVEAVGDATLLTEVVAMLGAPLPPGLEAAGTLDLALSLPGRDRRGWAGRLYGEDVRVGADSARLTLERVALELADGRVEGRVRLASADSRLDIHPIVDLGSRSLAGTVAGGLGLAAAASPWQLPIAGTAALDLRLAGSFDDPRPVGSIDVRGLAWSARTWPLRGGSLRVALRDGMAIVESGAGRLGDAAVTLSGRAPVGMLVGPRDRRAELTANLEGLDLTPLMRRSRTVSRLVSGGTLSGMVELAGRGLDPASWRGSAEVRRLELAMSDYSVGLAEPGRFAIEGGFLTIPPGTRFRGDNTDLHVQGNVELATVALDLQTSGTLGFEPLNVLSPYWGTGGQAQIDVDIRGTAPDLAYRGTAELRDVVLSPPPLRQPFEELRARLRFEDRRVRIDEIRGQLGGGRVTGEGEIFLRDSLPQSFRIAVDVDSATVRLERDVRVQASARLVHDGTPERSLLSGSIDLVEGRYRREYAADRALLELLESPDTDPDPLLSSIRLDLRVAGDENLFVDNNLADVEVTAAFDVRGTAADPVILGRSSLLRGRLFWNGNVFEVLQGTVELHNPFVTEPVFEVLARTEIRSYTIDLTLSGSLARGVQLDYTSTPTLSDLEMFNLLAFGEAPESETLQDPRRYQTALGLQATRYLTDAYFSEVERGARRLFGVDRFRISPTLSGREADATARLTVGKRINRNLYVTYSRLLSSSEDQLVTVEYQLSPRVRIKGTRDEDGSFGIDFLVQRRLRLR